MTVAEKIGLMGLVPVVVFDSMEHVTKTAKAMIEGGLPIMEITLRTEHGLPAIKKISEDYPEILLGAGTVLNLQQAKDAVNAGAKFIVSPGLNDEIVEWCINNNILITPGAVTPTEIEHALSLGLNVIKFFPANVYGGVNGCKALYGPYGMIKFVPTGGVSLNNLSEFVDKKYIHAIGGGWLCNRADIKAGNSDKVIQSVKDSISVMLGFEIIHAGTYTATDDELNSLFGHDVKHSTSSSLDTRDFELPKDKPVGSKGYVTVMTNNIHRAIYYLDKRGYSIDSTHFKEKDGNKIAVYLENSIDAFGIYLLQK